jgi:hypothetical protein
LSAPNVSGAPGSLKLDLGPVVRVRRYKPVAVGVHGQVESGGHPRRLRERRAVPPPDRVEPVADVEVLVHERPEARPVQARVRRGRAHDRGAAGRGVRLVLLRAAVLVSDDELLEASGVLERRQSVRACAREDDDVQVPVARPDPPLAVEVDVDHLRRARGADLEGIVDEVQRAEALNGIRGQRQDLASRPVLVVRSSRAGEQPRLATPEGCGPCKGEPRPISAISARAGHQRLHERRLTLHRVHARDLTQPHLNTRVQARRSRNVLHAVPERLDLREVHPRLPVARGDQGRVRPLRAPD